MITFFRIHKNRYLLVPPSKTSNAPTFKKNSTPVEIHHDGQNQNVLFKEMHKKNH